MNVWGEELPPHPQPPSRLNPDNTGAMVYIRNKVHFYTLWTAAVHVIPLYNSGLFLGKVHISPSLPIHRVKKQPSLPSPLPAVVVVHRVLAIDVGPWLKDGTAVYQIQVFAHYMKKRIA